MSLRGAPRACPRAGGGSNLSLAMGGRRLLRFARNDMVECGSEIASYWFDFRPKARMGLVSVIIRMAASSTPAVLSFGMKLSIR